MVNESRQRDFDFLLFERRGAAPAFKRCPVSVSAQSMSMAYMACPSTAWDLLAMKLRRLTSSFHTKKQCMWASKSKVSHKLLERCQIVRSCCRNLVPGTNRKLIQCLEQTTGWKA